MQVTFYGVRGSLPVSGSEYTKYGGHTACVHVSLNDGTQLILDSGTGIKNLGQHLMNETSDIHLLLTHNHWDHIQGFPFFAPIYQPDRTIFITPGMTNPAQDDAILRQMSGSNFPVHFESLPADIRLQTRDHAQLSWQLNGAKITRCKINHPSSGSAYRIDADGVSVVYITDNELYPPYKKETDFFEWVDFARDADLLIHDAQYMTSDMPAKSGWGHSVAEEAVKLAMASKVSQLALYSHDHMRTDSDIEAIEQHCQSVIEKAEMDLRVFAASEGMNLQIN